MTKLQIDPAIPRRTYWQSLVYTTTTPGYWPQFLRHTYQPFQILFTIPGVGYMSLVYGILQAWYCVMASSLGTYMIAPPYELSPTAVGLMNLSPFVGNTLGSLICGPLSDRLVLWLAKRRDGVYEPEMRLWLFVLFIPFQVAGAFWYGYALNNGQPWPAVAVAWGMCTFGTAPLTSTALTYMTDAYNEVGSLSPPLVSPSSQKGQGRVLITACGLITDHRRCSGRLDLCSQHCQHHLRLRVGPLGQRGRYCQRI